MNFIEMLCTLVILSVFLFWILRIPQEQKLYSVKKVCIDVTRKGSHIMNIKLDYILYIKYILYILYITGIFLFNLVDNIHFCQNNYHIIGFCWEKFTFQSVYLKSIGNYWISIIIIIDSKHFSIKWLHLGFKTKSCNYCTAITTQKY